MKWIYAEDRRTSVRYYSDEQKIRLTIPGENAPLDQKKYFSAFPSYIRLNFRRYASRIDGFLDQRQLVSLMKACKQTHPTVIALVHNTAIALCAMGTILLVWWLLKYSAYGFDFTDESFYLVSMANPFLHDYSHTQFGFVYHPIYNLLGGDIVKLRQFNILITFALAWCLAYTFFKNVAPEIKNARITLLLITAGIATSSLNIFNSWLLTPSYNSMALQALLITSIGLILSDERKHTKSLIGWSLIGIAGWLAFMAKPSTALALSFCVVFYLLLARKFSMRMISLSIAISASLLLLSAILIDGSATEFLARVQRAIDFGKILGSGHTLAQILRIDSFQTSDRLNFLIVLLSITVGSAVSILFNNNERWLFAALFIAMAFFSIIAILTFGYFNFEANLGQFQAFLIFGLVFAAIFLCAIFGGVSGFKSISRSHWALAFLFLATPHIYAFGTNGNYWSVGGSASIFWLLSGLLFLVPLVKNRTSWFLLLPVAIATQSVTIILLQTGFEHPYRQPQPIRLNDVELSFGAKKSLIVLSNGYAEYISAAISAAQNNDFKTGTPVIDLSGQSPGLLYALGATSIGQAWNVGAYPGSLNLAKVALRGAPCEWIATSWVLLEPNGPRSIPNDLMLSAGSAFPNGYSLVATWDTAAGAGGYPTPRRQELYKPLSSSEILTSCNETRANKTQG